MQKSVQEDDGQAPSGTLYCASYRRAGGDVDTGHSLPGQRRTGFLFGACSGLGLLGF